MTSNGHARSEWGEQFRGRQSQSVEIAFAILEEVARVGSGVTAAQISTNLKMPRSTAYRVIRDLVEAEWLMRMPDISGLALGHRLSELAAAARSEEQQPRRTDPDEAPPRTSDRGVPMS